MSTWVWLDTDANTDGNQNTGLPTGTIADGATHATANYMGIAGTVRCLGSDCEVENDKLVGSWYFHQTDAASTLYVRNPDRVAARTMAYVTETLYASYGHWLSANTTDATLWDVNTFAAIAGGGTSEFNAAASDDLDETASYTGEAAGMSVRTYGSGDDKTTDSGRFTATVTLNATFGASPNARGSISDFKGEAVNTGWSATLETAPLDATSAGTVVTNGRDGEWNAQAWGDDAAARPVGIFGGFSAHFSDGDAAGAYATRMDD